MNSESLNMIEKSAIREAQKKERAKQEAGRIAALKKERITPRLQPFKKLAERNQKVAEGCQMLIEASNVAFEKVGDADQSAWVILKTGSDGGSVGGFIEREYNTVSVGRKWSTLDIFEFKFYFLNGHDSSRIKSSPKNTKVGADNPYTESLYGVPRTHTYDSEIMQKGHNWSSSKRIEPVNLAARALLLPLISKRVDSMEQSLELYTQAILDSELNPHLEGVREILLPELQPA